MHYLTRLYLSGFLLLLSSLSLRAQTVTTFEGIDASQLAKAELDIDPNGAIGTKQYMEWTNVYYQAWSNTSPFTAVWSKPQAGTTPFTAAGLTQCGSIEGDGIVQFDRLASRWIIAAHNSLTPSITAYYYCIAISSTDDLTSSNLKWYAYAFPLDTILGTNSQGTLYFPDWPKLATWPDAYYLGVDFQDVNNGFQEDGVIACAFDRADMLIGATALPPQCFRTPTTGASLALNHSLQPADVEGTTAPPTGSPEYFVSIQNPIIDGVTTTSDSFNLWQFHVDWSNPANSTFTTGTVTSPSYTPGCYNVKFPTNTVCVPEPSTASTKQSIDSVGDRFMYRFSYRNFGTYQSYLVSHTVQVGTGALSQTGIRWYELRGNGVPTIYQSGTVSPDATNYRFMPSITQDQSANAAVGYSISSASMHPGIAASYWSLTNQTTPTELPIYSGTGDEENSYHWGDYTDMTVDPVGGCAFWYVNEYFTSNQTGTGKPIWQTRISTFTLPTCGSVSVAPTSLNFGSQAVGTTSAKQNVILTNSEPTALTINNIFGNGANSTDFGQSNDCGSSVPPGEACTISIDFAPTATGTRTANLVISDSANNSPQTITLTGVGTNGAAVSLSPASINFGNQADGVTTAPSSITVTNTGNAAVTFSSIGLTGTNSGNFGESNNCVPSLAAGNSCTINVTFSPTTGGSYSAAVTLTDNASNSPQSVSLSGTGVVPVTLSASSLGFGVVLVGGSKTAAAVTLTNQMSVALTGITVLASGNGYSQVNTCGTSVAAGGTCTITVTFKPTAAGASSGSVTITDSAPNSPQIITLTGTGQLPITVTPAALAFGSVKVGTSSAAKNVTVTNNTKTGLTITNITFIGTAAGDYSQTQDCGSILNGLSKCTINVTFTPSVKGSRPATLEVIDNATTSPQKVTLSGAGD
jgi:hypothetical protein